MKIFYKCRENLLLILLLLIKF